MAASDNVLRGGLTPKHIDVDELLAILDTRPGPAPRLAPREVAEGVDRFDADIADFRSHARARRPGNRGSVPGAAIVVATHGQVTVAVSASEVALRRVPRCSSPPMRTR